MRTQALRILFLISGVEAWTTCTPRALALEVAKGCATAATCAALLFSSPAIAKEAILAADDSLMKTTTTASAPKMPSSSIKVDINARYLFELFKTGDARTKTFNRVAFLADSIKDLFGPGVSVELPTDIKGFVRQALSGGAAIKVNGQDVAVKVIESTSGELTFQIYSKFIPALPFVGLKNTPAYVGAAASVIENAAPKVVDAVTAAMNTQPGPFWERLTLVDIIGGGSLALGVAYGSSYGLYQYEQYQSEQEAAEKRTENEAKMAKKKAAEKGNKDKDANMKNEAAVEAPAAPAKKVEEKNKNEAAAKKRELEASKNKEETLVLAAETAAAASSSVVVVTQEPQTKRKKLGSIVKSMFRSGEK